MQRYEITCLKCKQSTTILVNDSKHEIVNWPLGTTFLSGRWRSDMSWGWECICGNDNRVSLSEKNYVKELVKGTEQHVKDIVKSLSIDDDKQFRMVAV